MQDFTNTFGNSAAEALPAERVQFIRKTYLLLAAAILGFVVTEAFLFMSGAAFAILSVISTGGRMGWLLVLAAFMGVSYLANRWAMSDASNTTQYLGLAVYVIAEAVIFVPMIAIAMYASGDGSILVKAGIVTLGLFLGLTATVFLTRSDFSFLGPILAIGGFMALGFIVASALFGFSLGSVFAFVMVAFAGSAILYNTSNVMQRFNTNQYVAASLRTAVRGVDPKLVVLNVLPMDAIVGSTIASRKFNAALLGLFAALALALAATGVYGVLQYSVIQRRREMGIRLAIGATSSDMIRLIVGQAVGLAAIGVAIGLAGAFALTRVIRALLFNTDPLDAFTFAASAGVLLVIAVLSAYLPARRALRVDPTVAMRAE